MEQKYRDAIKLGIICGLIPSIVYGLSLLSNSVIIAMLGYFLFIITAIGSGTLAVYYAKRYLHSTKKVIIISGLAGAVDGITYSIIGIIIEIVWQKAANYINIGNHNFYILSNIINIPLTVLITVIATAFIATISGLIYIKFKPNGYK